MNDKKTEREQKMEQADKEVRSQLAKHVEVKQAEQKKNVDKS